LPIREPFAVGSKRTAIAHVCPRAKVVPQVLAPPRIEKSLLPLIATLEIIAEPLFQIGFVKNANRV
jgi:hypothetical protein